MSAALTLATFHALAAACAPGVAPDMLAAITRAESGLHVLALGIPSRAGRIARPTTQAEAIARATRLIQAGHAVDLGLMQINSRNLAWLGLTVANAFDPCRNIAAGARILTSVSRYNTGDAQRGFANGYVARVLAAAAMNAALPSPAAALSAHPPPPRIPALTLGRTVPGRTLTYGR